MKLAVVQTRTETFALAVKDHRADGFIGGHLLGGVDQSFEHRLVERVVLAGAHHRHIGYAAGADLNTNPVIGHPKQSTAGFRSALDYPSGTPPGADGFAGSSSSRQRGLVRLAISAAAPRCRRQLHVRRWRRVARWLRPLTRPKCWNCLSASASASAARGYRLSPSTRRQGGCGVLLTPSRPENESAGNERY